MGDVRGFEYGDFLSDKTVAEVLKQFDKLAHGAKERVAEYLKDIKAQQDQLLGSGKVTSDNIRTQEQLTESIKRVKAAQQQINEVNKQTLVLEGQILKEKQKQTKVNLDAATSLKQEKEATKQARIENEKIAGVYKQKTTLLQNLSRAVVGYIGAWVGLRSIISLITSVFNTTKKLDSIRYSMASVITDSKELAVTQQYLVNLSRNYGQELVKLSENYTRFSAATKLSNISSLERMNIFESVIKTSAVLGLSSQRTELALLALEQMASKGTVSMEELRRQLGDQIPGAVQIMADALGKSVPELYKMIKANQVLAEDALPKFARELENAYGIGNVNRVETLQAATGRLRTEWQLFVAELNASKVFSSIFDLLAGGVKRITDALKTLDERRLTDQFKNAKQDVDNYIDAMGKAREEVVKTIESQIARDKAYIDGANLDKKTLFERESRIKRLEESLEKIKELQGQISEQEAFKLIQNQIKGATDELNDLNIKIAEADELAKNTAQTEDEALLARKKAQKDYEKGIRTELDLDKDRAAYLTNYINLLSTAGKAVEENSKGYEEQLEAQIQLLKDQRAALPKADDATYYAEVDRLNASITKKEEELNRIRNKRNKAEKTYADAVREALGLVKQEKEEYEGLYDITVLIETNQKAMLETQKNIAKFEEEDRRAMEKIIERRNQAETDARLKRVKDLQDFIAELDGTNKAYFKDSLDLVKQAYEHELDVIETNEAIHIYTEEEANEKRLQAQRDFNRRSLRLWGQYISELVPYINEAYQGILDAASSYNDIQLDQAEREFDLHDKRIDELESRIQEEYELMKEGKDNEYDLLVSERARESALRQASFEELQKLRKREAAIEFAQQAGSLITASAKIFEAESSKGLPGVLLAIGAIAGMIAAFLQYKAKINSIEAEEPEYGEGGRVDGRKGKRLHGRTHKQGGIPVSAEDKEWIINAKSSQKSDSLLNDINEGKIDDSIYNLIKWQLPTQIVNNHFDIEKLSKNIKNVERAQKATLNYFRNEETKVIYMTKDTIRLKIGSQIIQAKING
jgi:tape measure domain-containing protein